MNTLLISDNLCKARFIQSALARENMDSTLSYFRNVDFSPESLFQYEGVLLLVTEFDDVVFLCNKIKSINSNKPIVVLSARKNSLLAELNDSGIIENYFVYPFQFRAISAELKFASFRAKESCVRNKWTLRGLELDYLTRKVRLKNQSVSLRNKEFCLLHFLMQNIGRVLSRTDIIENVWDRNALMLTNTVDVHIATLRKKIERTGESKFIKTIPYAGYLLE